LEATYELVTENRREYRRWTQCQIVGAVTPLETLWP
jgi:hypothetical protein